VSYAPVHCVRHIGLRLAVAATATVEREQLIGHASWKLRHTHAVDDRTWPACRWTCATVFATKIR